MNPFMIDVLGDMTDSVVYNSGLEKYLDDNWNSTYAHWLGISKDDILDEPSLLRCVYMHIKTAKLNTLA